MTPSIVDVVDGIDRAHQRLTGLLPGLTDDDVAAPSRLPGWSRGHVLAHLRGVGDAVVRQIEAALRDDVVEFYVGGRPARDAAIEARAGASADEHRRHLGTVLEQVEDVLDDVTPEVLARPTGFHGGDTTEAVLLAWWRELAIHLVDLDVGVGPASWDALLRAQVVQHLARRVPDGVQVVLEALDTDERWVLGDGEPVVLRAAATDLVAWLAGREPDGEIRVERTGEPADAPDLLPW